MVFRIISGRCVVGHSDGGIGAGSAIVSNVMGICFCKDSVYRYSR